MRFNAYADFFDIRKREDESLTTLMARIDQSMQNIRNLRPSTFSLTDLDDELIAMAMITALPHDYASFRSSLLLLDQVDHSTLQEAFRNEETNRLRDQNTANSVVSPQALAASSSSPQVKKCTFCLRLGHLEDDCYKKKAAMEQARKPRPRQAKNAMSASPPMESAGNASLRVSDPSSSSQPDTHSDWNADVRVQTVPWSWKDSETNWDS